MRGRYKRKQSKEGSEEADIGAGLSPLPGRTAAGSAEPDTPVPGDTVHDLGGSKGEGVKCSIYGGEKVYLGVRVKMPVKDLLKNVRLAQGWEPQELKEKCRKVVKGEMKRVKTRSRRQTIKVQHPTKSLEELAIIVEVLEEDLRTGSTYHSPPQSASFFDPPMSPELSPYGAGCNSDKYDEMIPTPQFYMAYSPEYQQTPSPPDLMYTGLEPSSAGSMTASDEVWEECNHKWNISSSAFFWTQLQKEESQLRDISDAVLLSADEQGRTALHKVAAVGKRALGYAIAKRMAALNILDSRDSDGMTALLYAAKHNHHLMVADLINLGADVNVKNNCGKSCLHLSAENGYVRVLEVLKQAMMDDLYVDVEATDNFGMSVLQCASLALKTTVCELENSKSHTHTRLHMLRQEQMMETLECLLQMGSHLHTMGSRSVQSRIG
ncbi:NF-kappa-B inhibitor zeta [Mugil cephalus]|uniref:NF-kappa-B inhibitor zeta n=1 Tax=Mugil cephalus TaxID=48193 RepID=UPI001FB67790|nr:NF-kappa-B inhibitor zeta [Mugil cephalus]